MPQVALVLDRDHEAAVAAHRRREHAMPGTAHLAVVDVTSLTPAYDPERAGIRHYHFAFQAGPYPTQRDPYSQRVLNAACRSSAERPMDSCQSHLRRSSPRPRTLPAYHGQNGDSTRRGHHVQQHTTAGEPTIGARCRCRVRASRRRGRRPMARGARYGRAAGDAPICHRSSSRTSVAGAPRRDSEVCPRGSWVGGARRRGSPPGDQLARVSACSAVPGVLRLVVSAGRRDLHRRPIRPTRRSARIRRGSGPHAPRGSVHRGLAPAGAQSGRAPAFGP